MLVFGQSPPERLPRLRELPQSHLTAFFHNMFPFRKPVRAKIG